MNDADWESGFAKSVAVFLNGDAIPERDDRGQTVVDDSFLLLFNASDGAIEWTLPTQWGGTWEIVVDTSDAWVPGKPANAPFAMSARSAVVLLHRR